jgi:mannose-1-phosphate guanylyltransferase / mannose-6-phosphate isomerase
MEDSNTAVPVHDRTEHLDDGYPIGTCYPVILCGGSGTGLWPVSRAAYPKQLLPLTSQLTLLQETLQRVADPERFAAPLVVCNDDHRFLVAEQLRQHGVAPAAILLEPTGRDTAPAAAAAALLLTAADPEAVMLLLPSDHYVTAHDGFWAAVDRATPAAARGALVTFGITPDRPETGYGYIRQGTALAGCPGCFAVERFIEKPDRATAEAYLAADGYAWNSGMFLFRAARYLAELARLEPAMLEATRAAVAGATRDLDFLRLDKTAFAGAPARSIDYAVMEKTASAAVVPLACGWSDVGSWAALWESAAKDSAGNALLGDVLAADVRNSYIRAESRLVAAVGLADVILVETADAVLAVGRERAQELRPIIEQLQALGRDEHRQHRRVYRPWGSYETVDRGERHQVKRIIVAPGGRLSLQKHAHRAEHWVVVRGTARVTRGDEVFELAENQSTYIPVGTVHRLENRGAEPLHLIEVQSGAYLGEDDIVRLEDTYGRA